MKEHTDELTICIEALEALEEKCVELSHYPKAATQPDLAMRISYLAGVRDALANVEEITQLPTRFKNLMNFCGIKTNELLTLIKT